MVYYIVSNALKMFNKMFISFIYAFICIKAYFVLHKCYYNFISCGQAFKIKTEIEFETVILHLHDKNC